MVWLNGFLVIVSLLAVFPALTKALFPTYAVERFLAAVMHGKTS